jgi:MFS superfamily sulfate permease-like transporter
MRRGTPGDDLTAVWKMAAGARSVLSRVPGLRVVSSYRREWLAKDLVAGVVLTTLLVPQGMAYAELAGLPAITGLYTSIMCLLSYAVLGPSRILVLGPDSSLGPMIAATILPLLASGGDPGRAVALASTLAIITAAIMVVAAIIGPSEESGPSTRIRDGPSTA